MVEEKRRESFEFKNLRLIFEEFCLHYNLSLISFNTFFLPRWNISKDTSRIMDVSRRRDR